jgi:hypothetical protein
MAKLDARPVTPPRAIGIRKIESHVDQPVQSPTRTAKDATGINLEERGPINPKMPQLPPA